MKRICSLFFFLAVCSVALHPPPARSEDGDNQARKVAALARLKQRSVAASAENLRAAAMSGDAGLVKALLEAGVDPNARFDDLPQSILHLASVTSCTRQMDASARDAVVAALLQGGADPNAIEMGDVPLLIYVAQQCPRPVVEAFIAGGARLDDSSPQGFTALSMALIVKNIDAAEALVDHGARLSPAAVAKLFPKPPEDARVAALVKRAAGPQPKAR